MPNDMVSPMRRWVAVFYDSSMYEVGDHYKLEALDLPHALNHVASIFHTVQGNAHITSVDVYSPDDWTEDR